jgi:hypothetical protein
MASRANVYIDQSSDFRIVIELDDEDGDNLPIASYTFYSTIRKMYSSTKVADFTIEKDTVNATITLILSDEVTGSMKPGKYQYDVLMKKTSGEMVKVVEGLAFVIETITNPNDLSSGSIIGGDANGITDGDNLDGGQY